MATSTTEPSTGATTISLTPEQFERLYLSGTSSSSKQSTPLTAIFGDPAPLAVLGLCLSLMPLSCDLMGWRGSGIFGAASTGAYFFEGGFLMVLSGILEFFLNNTFLFTIFTGYGAFWLTYGATLQPTFASYSTYSPDPLNAPTSGLSTTGFTASFGFYLLFMALFSFFACICALKTNLCLVILEFFLILFFALLAADFFLLADGGGDASAVQTASGAFGFVSCVFGWYYFFALSLRSVGAVELPVFVVGGGKPAWSMKGKANGRGVKDETTV